jgi:ribosomal protein S3
LNAPNQREQKTAMIRHFIIGVSLVALGVIVAGSLDSARIASPRLATTEGRSPLHTERATPQIGWQRALPQAGAAALHLTRMPATVTPGR